MRTFGTILALLLIFFGLVVAGLVFVRIWQDNGLVRLDINTASVSTPTATVPVSAAVRAAEAANAAATAAGSGEAGAAGSTAPVVVGIESGGMSLAGGGGRTPRSWRRRQTARRLLSPWRPVDPCPPAPAEGFAADTAVVAVGTLRVYSQADVTSPALRDLTAGQGLWIVAGEDGSTAIARCEVIWQRVRTADGLVGWVIKDAVDVVPRRPPANDPRPRSWRRATVISPCVGGCPTPCCQPCPTPCNQPCPTPCCQPCAAQPCTSPCGVYTQ